MILILGNLYITEEFKKKFNELDEDVVYIEKAYDGIEKIILKSNYICACNFNLNKYIDYLNPNQYIVMAETGIVNIDLNKVLERNLNVCNLKNYSCDAVVQYIVYCAMRNLRPWNLYFQNESMKKEIMDKESTGIEALKVGIIGYGTIGKAVSKVLSTLNCEILVKSGRTVVSEHVKNVSIDKLFEKSDVIIVCCSLNNTSREMIDYSLLSKLKSNSSIISISQIGIFNETDLNKFLKERNDIKAYLDFDFDEKAKKLNEQSNVYVSPHVAFFTHQTILGRTKACIEKIRNYISLFNEKTDKAI